MDFLPEPRQFKELVKRVTLLESPDFKKLLSEDASIIRFGNLNYYSSYASIIESVLRNNPDRFDEGEKTQIRALAHKLGHLQKLSYGVVNLRDTSPDLDNSIKNYASYLTDYVKQTGYLLMPAGSRTHSVILEIEKKGEEKY